MKVRIGALLEHWRTIRGMSQFELSERAGVSTRHLNFIENGKAQPSRDAVLWLAQALDVPAPERAAFLEAAGYLPDAGEPPPDPELLAELRRDLDALMAGLEPRPAAVHDVLGTLHAVNGAFRALTEPLVGSLDPLLGVPSSGHRLLARLAPHFDGGDPLTALYLRRVRDAMLRGHGAPEPHLQTLWAELSARHADALEALDRRRRPPLMTRIALRVGDRVLAFDGVTTSLGTPAAVGLRTLRLAIFLPHVAAHDEAPGG